MTYDEQTSSAMNYYEELGVSQEATDLEIRKAHRRLVKLMHPDAQPDPNLKMLAETQMRRLNSIVSTLLDPQQRRSYDDELGAARTSFQQADSDGRHFWRGIPWWLASTVGAVVLTLAAVWLWADHLGSSFGTKPNQTVYIPPSENPPIAALPAAPSPNTSDFDHTKPLGASYTSPVTNSQPPQISDQPKASDQQRSNQGGISATVITEVPPVSPKPVPGLSAKQVLPPAVKAEAQVKSQSKSQSVVVVTNHLSQSAQKAVMKAQVKPPPTTSLRDVKKQTAPKMAAKAEPKTINEKLLRAHTVPPPSPLLPATLKPIETASAPKKLFSMPPDSLVARVTPAAKNNGTQIPTPPRVNTQNGQQPSHDYGSSALPNPALPAPMPPKLAVVTTTASGAGIGSTGDPLEGEWVYAPKEPERHRAGFYPPEFIDLKLFGSGDPGSLKGQYSAKYVVTDRPVAPEVTFDLAAAAKGSRRFVWQSNTGAKGTMNIDAIDDRTIRVDWHTTSAVHGPALTSGTATLVRRQ